MQLRDYQIEIAQKAKIILGRLFIVYISAEVRTGKTLMALETARLYGAKNVLFLTKKKAISSIQGDYTNFGYADHFTITITNNESLHKVEGRFDLVVHDESHRFGNFPKPPKQAIEFKKRFAHLPLILLSGTPTPESYSQIYHQFWVSDKSPFRNWKNFYTWAKDFVKVYQVNYGYGLSNLYDKALKEKIDPFVAPYFIRFTQKQAGFQTEVKETILHVPMAKLTYDLAHKLRRDKVLQGTEEVILADTSVKEMNKLHQLFSGTCKFESGNAQTFDKSKAFYIRDRFVGTKIGIFYKFKQEYILLKEVFGENLTDDLDTFNTTDKSIALQIQSGREGISLKLAKYLVYYNLDFSATSYYQSKDRMSTMERLFNEVFYVFTEGGIEDKIWKSLMQKKSYTVNQFERDYAGI